MSLLVIAACVGPPKGTSRVMISNPSIHSLNAWIQSERLLCMHRHDACLKPEQQRKTFGPNPFTQSPLQTSAFLGLLLLLLLFLLECLVCGGNVVK